ncbi:MAG TPA: Rne/Rng family ribonuclease [Bryobacteraceae bacterium]|nr:Rne/Rng family ribonuclease [Bryobacteraceae bacterium]
MSKELIVSANRHETRVAVIEDDQVTEVYHQRENEYSLAGSIHKGRVTRVLPGMQSAFVDIGLERDAFLYVSDFFEDNEEYDKIVTSVEDKILKMEKTPPPPPVAAVVVPPAAPVAAEPAAEAPPVVVAQPSPAAAPAAGDQFARRNDERDRDRRGRRSRRRRPRGRGLPESKFFTPDARPEPTAAAPPAPEEATEAEEEAEEIIVLPGESLAKYREERPAEPEPASPELEPEAEPEPPVAFEAIAELVETAEGVEVLELPEEPAVESAAPEAESAADVAEIPVEVEVESVEIEMAEYGVPESEVSEAETSQAEPAEIAEGELSESGQQEVAAPVDEEQLGPEPARIPTSLTATLREQGPRYLHRVSRRMRRRGRGEGADFQQRGEAGRESRPQEQRADNRPVSRPEAPRSERPGSPSITDLLREGQEIIVQIAKEPLGQKGARITSHIALPGRFLVYMPTVDHIGVSRKIPSDEERMRLKRVLQANRSGIPGGYIVRTAGEGHTEEELRADMLFLYNLWLDLRQKAEKRPAPALVHHDLDVVERILRDQLTASFKSIWVDNEEVYENVLGFVQRFQPALVSRVRLYTRSTPIFDEYGITAELEKALRPKVWLKTGGHIVINQTEALVAIDVNTGKYVGKSNRLEDTIVKTNTDAIKEIVRQIRLRDLGGIIVVDFIDMDERKNRQKVMQALEEAMRADRAPYKILQFNDFGLVAITRKRVKQSLERTLCTPCPYCDGSGYVKSVQTVIGEILQEAQKIARAVEGSDVMLRVNPEVAKVLKSNQNSYLQEIEEILGRTVMVKSDPLLHQEKFDLA